MSADLLEDVRKFLPALEATQEEFTFLFAQKRTALTQAESKTLLRLSESETKLTQRMRSHLGERQRILQKAAQNGLSVDSIEKLVIAIPSDDAPALKEQIERARRSADHIRRESWIQWIISQRTLSQCNELLEMIAHCGRKSPTYSSGPSNDTGGGAILDASI